MNRKIYLLVGVLLISLGLVACEKKDTPQNSTRQKGVPKQISPTKTTADEESDKLKKEEQISPEKAAWLTEAAAKKRQITEGLKARKVRLIKSEHIGFDEKDGAAKFKLVNTSENPIKRAQAWVYYYDKDGKLLSRYPHSFMGKIKPNGSTERSLGYKKEKFPEGAEKFEVEITEATFKDDSKWRNSNLSGMKRNIGGESEETLMKNEGEMVIGKWTGKFGKKNKPVFWLTNISGRPLKANTIWPYYYGENGEDKGRDVINTFLEIAPDETVEFEGGDEQDKLKEGTAIFEIVVSRVTMLDGSKEEWENQNLSAPFRRMETPTAAPK